jgi:hypothetical protein
LDYFIKTKQMKQPKRNVTQSPHTSTIYTSPLEIQVPPKTPPAKDTADGSDGKLEACDLFSLFTADIIKKDVPFTR